jgi:cation-transporting ATPase E
VSDTASLTGLTSPEVAQRVAEGRVNVAPDTPGRTLGEIVRANVFTPVNAIIGALFVVILVARQPGDALFMGVIISNTAIGIVQELRTRSELNRLEVLNAPHARVVRDGAEHEVTVAEVVADDVLRLGPGDQVVVDGEVLAEQGLELDESLLTGESEPVSKQPGDEVLSGSFVVVGSGWVRATRVGGDAYAAKLAEQARVFTLVNSELRSGINLVLRRLVIIIPPVALLLLWRLLLEEDDWREALRGTVAASVAMVPDGLVLLTSIAFMSGILALARRNALAKELATVELLARVDVLCLDKTGTITTGEISYADAVAVGDVDEAELAEALGAVAHADPDPNPTLVAIASRHAEPDGWTVVDAMPFSSARKWASTTFADRGCWYLGAPEILLAATGGDTAPVRQQVDTAAHAGHRVLLLARSATPGQDETLPADLAPAGVVLLEDDIRPDAREILEYFAEQGVTLKVISGDNPATVAAVAQRAGVAGADTGYDARQLPEDAEALAEVLDANAVFGRVQPHQKQAMVGALQARGHVVAMTGDGVNDVLALKSADMGIAMGAGSAASRAVAQLTLLDNRFSTLPRVLAEGRRVINNIERVANLFVTKATYAVLLAALTGILGVSYPFLPRQLTLIGTFSIGVPGFFLALEANSRRSRPGFIARVLRFSIPAGIVAGSVAFITYYVLYHADSVTLDQARTGATFVLLGLGLVVLAQLTSPIKPWKILLVVMMGVFFVATLSIDLLRDYFEIDPPPAEWWTLIVAAWLVGAGALIFGPRLVPRWGAGVAEHR